MDKARIDLLLRAWARSTFLVAIFLLAVLVGGVVVDGYRRLTAEFLLNPPSADPDRAGIFPSLAGSIWVVTLATLIAVPMGIGFSVYVVEYLRCERLRGLLYFIVETLAGVPSVVYGIVALGFIGYQLGMGRSVLTGAIALAFLILPLIVVASVEALRSVPDSLRMSAYSLGASRTQVVAKVVLPLALPGAITGSILAVARALGETAPILVISGVLFTRTPPTGLLDSFTVLPLQIFNWITRPQSEFRELAAAGILVLFALFFLLNFLAFYYREAYTRRLPEV